MDIMEVETLVVITSIKPLLLAWLAAISFFMSLAITAVLSPKRRWFELVVIFALAFGLLMVMGGFFFQLLLDVEIFVFEAVETLRMEAF